MNAIDRLIGTGTRWLSSVRNTIAVRDADKVREARRAAPSTNRLSQIEADIKAAERTVK